MDSTFVAGQNPGLRLILNDNCAERYLVFDQPRQIILLNSRKRITQAFDQIEAGLDQGLWAAGFLSYELGYCLEKKLDKKAHETTTMPLLYVGLFDEPLLVDASDSTRLFACPPGDVEIIEPPQPALDLAAYQRKFDIVKEAIRAGDIYQLNLTFQSSFKIKGDPQALYQRLAAAQPVKHGGFFQTNDFSILSLSPELFIKRHGQKIETRPMKGTEPRGHSVEEDEAARIRLTSDAKQQAENLMIVDLMRNDLSRITQTGSVKVPDLFTVETYPTLHQLISRVTGTLQNDVTVHDIFRALFPCGSITGAPKIRAMEIIRDLEEEPRNVYCGSLGYIAPDRDMHFNVAIRSITISSKGEAEIGIGSGVVADSEAASEYQEALLKMRFLQHAMASYDLFETMLYEKNQGIWLLDEHMARMKRSATALGFAFDEDAARAKLTLHLSEQNEERLRVRLVLAPDGTVSLTSVAMPKPEAVKPIKFLISPTRLDSSDPFLKHKTTRRALYDKEFHHYNTTAKVDEVIYLNERDELTEGSRTNIFLKIDGILLTPPLVCGLLPGTLRAHLLQQKKASETCLTRTSLEQAEAIYLGNSVRGLQEAELQR